MGVNRRHFSTRTRWCWCCGGVGYHSRPRGRPRLVTSRTQVKFVQIWVSIDVIFQEEHVGDDASRCVGDHCRPCGRKQVVTIISFGLWTYTYQKTPNLLPNSMIVVITESSMKTTLIYNCLINLLLCILNLRHQTIRHPMSACLFLLFILTYFIQKLFHFYHLREKILV